MNVETFVVSLKLFGWTTMTGDQYHPLDKLERLTLDNTPHYVTWRNKPKLVTMLPGGESAEHLEFDTFEELGEVAIKIAIDRGMAL
jgi:hypothetical protein